VKENGETADERGFKMPAPFEAIVTFVALPPKLLPATVTGVIPQVAPVRLLRRTVGPLTQPHETVKGVPVLSHPDEFLTVIT
jgi:hypothetical protein